MFEAARARGEAALVTYVMGGDPDLATSKAAALACADGGADLLEIGMPFSDPIADGPTIQASTQRALDRGVTPHRVLEMLAGCSGETPLVLMGYYNPILRWGLESFARDAKRAGVSGVIVSDLIPEEAGEWRTACREVGLDSVMLAAPTSTPERMKAVCEASTGFVYLVSRTGVTGAQQTLAADLPNLVRRVQEFTTLPVCVGFGVSRPDQVSEVAIHADGVVIGSWLVDRLAATWDSGRGRDALLEEVRALKAATR
jgi:tryptophan synthase alpha chain